MSKRRVGRGRSSRSADQSDRQPGLRDVGYASSRPAQRAAVYAGESEDGPRSAQGARAKSPRHQSDVGAGVDLVLGINSVRTALKFGAEGVSVLWLDQDRRDARLRELSDLARAAGIRVETHARDELNAAAAGENHQGALAWARMPTARSETELDALLDGLQQVGRKEPPFLLVLDGITDPHNLGACLRSADGAGVHAVIAPKDKSVGLTPVAIKVASGAAASVPFFSVTNLARTLDALRARGIWVMGAAGEAEQSLYQLDLRGPLALVLGSEGSGMRRLTRERCDHLFALPMKGAVESLNVSVAAGICLYEALRQRLTSADFHRRYTAKN